MVSAGNEHNPLGEFDVLAALSHAGHEFIDKRDNGGCLWVPDKPGVEDFLRQSGVFEQFSYSQLAGKLPITKALGGREIRLFAPRQLCRMHLLSIPKDCNLRRKSR